MHSYSSISVAIEIEQIQKKLDTDFSRPTPQDQWTKDANICRHDRADQDCLFPLWHCSKRPALMNLY